MSKIAILGAGESGAGAAVLAKKQGFDVFVSDMSKIADKYKQMLDDRQIAWEECLSAICPRLLTNTSRCWTTAR